MKSLLFTLVAISAVLFSCMEENKTVQASEPEPIVEPAPAPDREMLGAGGKLYYDNCSVCHGFDGKKKYDGAKDLSISKLSMENRLHIIASAQVIGNKEHKPRWKPILNEEEIYLVSQYLDSLKQ